MPLDASATRRRMSSTFKKPARSVVLMEKNRGGRPRKGPRVYVNSPISPSSHELLERFYELTGAGKGPTVARLFETHIAELQREIEALEAAVDAQEGQNRIDLGDLRKSA